MSRRLFLDMDGVLADFDTGYYRLFGELPDRSKGDRPEMWKAIEAHGSFYRDLEMMPDAYELLAYTRPWRPIVLTGMPDSVPDAMAQKMAWVREHIGDDVLVIGTKSRDKSLWARPGDVLVDDWEKYRDRWEQVGGVWITHRTAERSIEALQRAGWKP